MSNIRSFRELKVWQRAMDAAMAVFQYSKRFPDEERYSLTDQVRRSSRSVAANISEAWRKRRYPAAFVSKLNDSEGEAAETQTHLEIALRCGYLSPETARELDSLYDEILAMLVAMIDHPEQWAIPRKDAAAAERRGDAETRRPGDAEERRGEDAAPASPRLPLTPSPRLLQKASPPLRVSASSAKGVSASSSEVSASPRLRVSASSSARPAAS